MDTVTYSREGLTVGRVTPAVGTAINTFIPNAYTKKTGKIKKLSITELLNDAQNKKRSPDQIMMSIIDKLNEIIDSVNKDSK